MKPIVIVAALVLLAGIYVEYNKDSSFSTMDTGSLVIGTGVGLLAGHFIG